MLLRRQYTFALPFPTAVQARLAPVLNATNPDLREFRARGGRLLQYHGRNDQLIAPESSIDYYEKVVSFFGAGRDRTEALRDVQSFYRLVMAPGMAHCGGGTGPNTFDMQTVLEHWLERGVAPEQVIATRAINGVVDRLRPLCPYPQVAVYKGQGNTNEAASFACQDSRERTFHLLSRGSKVGALRARAGSPLSNPRPIFNPQ